MNHSLPTNARAAAIQPSATLAVSGRAKQLKAEGKQVLPLGSGEPDFCPPAPVVEAVRDYISKNPVLYTEVPGTAALRDAIADDLEAHHGRRFARDELLVSCGAKHSLANLFLVTLEPGDEVVIPAPYWVSYPDMVRLGGGTPVIAATSPEHGLRLQPDALARVLSPRTRFLVLNSPSNPTGVGYTGAQLRALGEVLAAKAPQAWLLCDDIYRHLVYDGFVQESAFRALDGVTEQIILVDGVSKSHAMTGFRIGYMAGPREVVGAAARVQGQMTSGASTISQVAATAALTDPRARASIGEMREAFARRRALVLAGLSDIPGVHTPRPDGAFYVFPDVSRFVGEGARFADDLALAAWLLEEKLVAVVPGTPFGAPGHLRISYATSDDTLREALSRLQEAFRSLPARA
ncbi:MAG: pyridoxal phosphate-dependent aminotransferase [Myxococcales bacterium]|nr:pyridoxal phosphate-dependent aminotransferase [Myxococcales bacterium]